MPNNLFDGHENNDAVKRFIEEFKNEYNELKETGHIGKAKKLNDEMKECKPAIEEKFLFKDDVPPTPFYGDLFNEFVFVNYNTAVNSEFVSKLSSVSNQCVFEDYFEWLKSFDDHCLEDSDGPGKYDSKIIPFLLPFDQINKHFKFHIHKNAEGIIDIKATYRDMQNIRCFSRKCQLESFPYSSSSFDAWKIPIGTLRNQFYKLLEIIFAVKRKVIIFNGNGFNRALRSIDPEYIVSREQRKTFKLNKTDGTEAAPNYSYSVWKIRYKSIDTKVIVANSFPRLGLSGSLMYQYGKKIVDDEFLE